MSIREKAVEIANQVGGVAAHLSDEQAEALVAQICQAKRIFLAGEGRTGLMARAFAMRLMQLGLSCHVVGEVTTPAIGPGDLLVICSGSGAGRIPPHLAELARQAGGTTWAVTSQPESPLASNVSGLLLVPGTAKTAARENSSQLPGSLFEQSLLIALDALAEEVRRRRGETEQSVMARHANLE